MEVRVTRMFVPERDELLSEIKALRGEIERLKQCVTDYEWAMKRAIEKREAENERLRAALAECEANLAIWEAPDQRW